MRSLNPDEPTRLGDFRLIAHLGSGGMGRVYLGVGADGRTAAVRSVRADLAADPGLRARFARATESAPLVHGRFAPPLLGHDLSAPLPWTATAYVPGPSLRDLVHRAGPLPATALTVIARGLAEALECVHAAGAVHCGLEPGNVLVDAHGPWLTGFGVPRAVEGTRFTRPDEIIGIPAYRSPEYLSGGRATPAGDLFSLGGTLLFAATGAEPFGQGRPADVLLRVLREPPRLDGVPEPLRALVSACLDKLPENRPTASDVLSHLGGPLPDAPPQDTPLPGERLLEGPQPDEPSEDPQPAPWLPPRAHEVVTRTERAYRAAVADAGVLVDVTEGTGGSGLSDSRPGPRPGSAPHARVLPAVGARPRRGRRVLLRAVSLVGVVVLVGSLSLYALTAQPWEPAGAVDAGVRDCSAAGRIADELAPPDDPQVTFPTGVPLELSFSPDGSVLAVSQIDGVTLWNWRESRALATISNDAPTVPPSTGAFSPDGCLFAYGTLNGAVVTDLATGRERTVGAEENVRSVAFSPDGSTLAVGVQSDPGNRLLHLHDTATWELETALSGSGGLGAIQYSLNGATVAGGETGGGVAVWDTGDGASGPPGLVRDRAGTGADAFDVVPDGSGVLVIRDGRVLLVEPETEEVLRTFAPGDNEGVLVDVAYSATSSRVLAARLDPVTGAGDMVAWQFHTGDEVPLGTDLPRLFPIALSPDGSRLAGVRAETGDIAIHDTDLSLLGVISD